MPSYVPLFDYQWRNCPDCATIWKMAPPLFCMTCGIATVAMFMPVLPDDSLLHGSTTGYRYGCKCNACTDAHRMAYHRTKARKAGLS